MGFFSWDCSECGHPALSKTRADIEAARAKADAQRTERAERLREALDEARLAASEESAFELAEAQRELGGLS